MMREIANLEELKTIELDIMKKIHDFCEKNNIEYVLASGTMLGAVRHKGFIPWDDDIDIFMTRNNYEKFLKLFKQHKKNYNLEIANHMTEIYFGRPFTKVFDKDTYMIEPQYKTDDPIGVFVDIWPLDKLPQNTIKRYFVKTYAFFLKKILLASSMKYDNNYRFFKKFVIVICKLFNPKQLVLKLDKLANSYNQEDSELLFCYAGQEAVYSEQDFKRIIKIQFEDSEFYIPENYDNILKAEYGNYMQLPPQNERIPHHIMNVYYK